MVKQDVVDPDTRMVQYEDLLVGDHVELGEIVHERQDTNVPDGNALVEVRAPKDLPVAANTGEKLRLRRRKDVHPRAARRCTHP